MVQSRTAYQIVSRDRGAALIIKSALPSPLTHQHEWCPIGRMRILVLPFRHLPLHRPKGALAGSDGEQGKSRTRATKSRYPQGTLGVAVGLQRCLWHSADPMEPT